VKQEDPLWKFLWANQSSFMFGVGMVFFPTPVFLAIHYFLPSTLFGQKFSSARNQMLFIDRYS